jgi:hypothetical protein
MYDPSKKAGAATANNEGDGQPGQPDSDGRALWDRYFANEHSL